MAEKKKIELIKLTIQIGDTKVSVTKDEARDLHKALSEMFGTKTEHVHHYDYQRPWYWPHWSSGFIGSSSGCGLNIGSSNAQQAIGGLNAGQLQAQADLPQLSYSAGAVTLSAADYRVVD